MDKLSSILSHLMSKNNISSAELARKTGVGQPVIYRLMTGTTENPQIFTLKPIADFFGVTLDQLLGSISFSNMKMQNNISVHDITNKLTTIKTICSVLVEILPSLSDGYKKAVLAQLIKEETPSDILPLIQLNSINLLKTINQLQEILTIKNEKNTTQD